MDVVGEGVDHFVVAVVPLEGDLRFAVLPDAGDVNDVGVQGLFTAVEVADEFPDAPLIAHGVPAFFLLLVRAFGPLVGDGDAQARVEEGLLPHAHMEGLVVVDRVLEHLRVRLEADGGTRPVRIPDDLHILGLVPPAEFHLVNVAAPVYLHLQPLREGVDHAGAHAVKAAGNLIAPAAEFSARVEHGIHHLQGGLARLLLHIHGDAPPVVGDADHVPRLDGDGDVAAEARQGFVDGVVHDLIDQMVQAGRGGGADIHARPKTHGLQPLQDLDLGGVVAFFGLKEFAFFRHGILLWRAFPGGSAR